MITEKAIGDAINAVAISVFTNKEIGGNSTKTINANKDSAREAPAIPLKIMIQREHLVRVLIHVI